MLTTMTERITVQTTAAPQFIDLTDQVLDLVDSTGVRNGVAVVYTKHTTASIQINENESLLIEDMKEYLEKMAPRDGDYRHNDFSIRTENMTEDECPNGHAHCQNLSLGPSESIPVIEGELQLGRWQRVFLVELDRERERHIIVQVLGN
ncbi:MAG: secondary thiamine-phosphate synthase enzyme YjbQ [Candidatus Bipolaricaulota bacterium]